MPSAGTASPPRRDGIASRACSRPTPHPSSEGRSGGLAPGRTSHPSSEEQRKRTRWGLEHRSRLAHQRKLFGAQRAHRQAHGAFLSTLCPDDTAPAAPERKPPRGQTRRCSKPMALRSLTRTEGSSELDGSTGPRRAALKGTKSPREHRATFSRQREEASNGLTGDSKP
jgi:hypothetical protein